MRCLLCVSVSINTLRRAVPLGAGLDDGQTAVPDVLDDGADAYIPGIVRRYDREFQVDFTNK